MQFKIASQTKAFTANLILQLVGEGKVSLDDHISKWVAGVPNGDQITIRQLLNLTSGLADGFLVRGGQPGKLATGCTVDGDAHGRRGAAPGRAARHEVVLQQLRLQPAGAGRGAGDGPGPEHGDPAAHRPNPSASTAPSFPPRGTV